MGSKIGFITNLGTSAYAMLPLFEKNSKEYKELVSRLIITRKLQGNEIDRAKGILVKNLPKWDKRIKITDEMSDEEKEKAEFKNRIVINRRPLFMIYLYPEYKAKYKNHYDIYENYATSIYGYGIREIVDKKDKFPFEKEIYHKYMQYNPFLDTDCVMGFIYRYMDGAVKEFNTQLVDKNFDFESLINSEIAIDEKKLKAMELLLKKYKKIKSNNFLSEEVTENAGLKYSDLNEYAYKKISSNSSELANLAVYLCYKKLSSGNRDFAWIVFGKEILENLQRNGYDRALLPLLDPYGDIYYLGERYSNLYVKLEEKIDDNIL